MTTTRVTVPVEPTEAMLDNAIGTQVVSCPNDRQLARQFWSAMLSAAPAPEGGAVKGPGDYTMCIAEPQTFERFPALASHIERMAVGRSVGSLIEWDAFLRELNAALATREDAQPVAWTGSGSLARIKGRAGNFQGYIYGTPDAAHPIALYTHPAPDALRVAVEALKMIHAEVHVLREEAGLVSVRAHRLNKWWSASGEALAALQAEQGAK